MVTSQIKISEVIALPAIKGLPSVEWEVTIKVE
jgi:hypothetical protein